MQHEVLLGWISKHLKLYTKKHQHLQYTGDDKQFEWKESLDFSDYKRWCKSGSGYEFSYQKANNFTTSVENIGWLVINIY